MGPVLDHLWQSTLFLGVAAIVAWSLRRYHARVRYVVWLIASVKFLVPYAVLVAAVHLVPLPRTTVVVPPSTTVFLDTADAVTTPFSGTPHGAARVAVAAPSPKLPLVLGIVWLLGTVD